MGFWDGIELPICPNCKIGKLTPHYGEEFDTRLEGIKIEHCRKCGASYRKRRSRLTRERLAEK